jgi:SAM-dependent methyltransferase
MTGRDQIVLETGQRIIFRLRDSETVVYESFLPAQQHGLQFADDAPPEQRFEVLEGTLGFWTDGAETLLTAGSRLTVRRGTQCRYWNAGAVQAHVMAEVRPPLDFERYARERSRILRSIAAMSIDWGIGRYEETAAALEPAAVELVRVAGIEAGARVLDVGCGTGNATLAAARAGADATGVDPAERLLETARERASDEGLDVTFAAGRAEELPFADGSFDIALSAFGIIFASDPVGALTELLRVLKPGGRAFVSVWVPAGAVDAMMGVFRRATAAATGSARQPFAWSDADAVAAVVASHGASVRVHEREIAFVGDSPAAYFELQERTHPMALASRPLLERAGTYDAVRAEALGVIEQGNEDPAAFRTTSPYRILEIRTEP